MKLENCKIAVIGLGYVGLPLAVEFGKKYPTVGFDINLQRVNDLHSGIDHTNEVELEELHKLLNNNLFSLSNEIESIKGSNIFIITVPTPIDKFKVPELTPLLKASKMIGEILKKGDVVIYESTVYPGCTEEDCVPVLELYSGLIFNSDFYCGYSPERINPGDKINTLTKIKKVTSGSTPEVANLVDDLYSSIITAGTHKAPTLKVAEASKAIENAQRDVNISFINELALIFDKMGIDTNDVLEAAGTKWNFLKFKPGLVGGHCIGVDPYYLAHKAIQLGYNPEVILSGRRINDYMGRFIANKIIKHMIYNEITIKRSNALILGFTFKENCPDIRNTKVIDIKIELEHFDIKVDIFDPLADKNQVEFEYGFKLIDNLNFKYDIIILAVSHLDFLNLDLFGIKNTNQSIIFDLKGFLDRDLVDFRL
jgi:UDP-N-acetyl-D-galactosamine dehydrogenase